VREIREESEGALVIKVEDERKWGGGSSGWNEGLCAEGRSWSGGLGEWRLLVFFCKGRGGLGGEGKG